MEQVLEKRSNLVLPTTGYELDREEMSYVDGGAQISYSTLVSEQSSYLRNFYICSASVLAFTIIAAKLYSSVFTEKLALVSMAAAAAATVAASFNFANYTNATNAKNTIKYYESIGKSYSIYKFTSGFISTYIVN